MNTRSISFAFLLSFVGTLLALRDWQLAEYPAWVWTAVLAALLVTCGAHVIRTVRPYAVIGTASVLGIMCAFWCVARTTHVLTPTSPDTYATGAKAEVRGRVAVTDIREGSARYTIKTSVVTDENGEHAVQGRTLVITRSSWPRAHVGDVIEAYDEFEKPEAFDGFAYDEYLSAFGVYSIIRPNRIEVVKRQEGWNPLDLLARNREAVTTRITTLLPEPHASLLDGLLTGNRASVPQDVLDDFATAGLTHVLAISGYNIGIVLSLIAGMLFFLPLRWRLVPSILAVIAFTLFVGASASVVRAAVMGILGLFAMHAGRINDARLGTLWTAFFMLAWNPKYLWFDPSFQLSFLAVAGLVELQPFIGEWMKRIPETLGLRDALGLTIAAQIFAAPWTLLLFGRFSLIAPLANVFVAPLVPLSMLLGTLAIIGDWLWAPLGQLIALANWLTIQGMLTAAYVTARIPLASFSMPDIKNWHAAAYYLLLAGTLMRLNHRKKSHELQTSRDNFSYGTRKS